MTPMDRTLIALYDDVDDALATIEALVEMGFDREALSLCMRDPHAKEANLPETHKERAAASIERGALVGGVWGLLAVWGQMRLPGIGAILASAPSVGYRRNGRRSGRRSPRRVPRGHGRR